MYVPATNMPLKCHIYAIYANYSTYNNGRSVKSPFILEWFLIQSLTAISA